MHPAARQALRLRHLGRLSVKTIFAAYLVVIWLGLVYVFVIALRHA